MADNDTTTPAGTEAAAEHTVTTTDAQSIEAVLDGLVEDPAAEPQPEVPGDKSDETFEPLGTVINRP
ncbi:hypothetical protein [Kitasatospora sp. NPDC051914]|uniref:hypothetical protein n=1 Tax=Kitasatospora sp. NPDC051914 TaxID=3154945 RepID=UPI00341B8FED